MVDTERVISAITIERLRSTVAQSTWIARAMVVDANERLIEGRSYAASGNTPAKALFYLKEAIQQKEGWSW